MSQYLARVKNFDRKRGQMTNRYTVRFPRTGTYRTFDIKGNWYAVTDYEAKVLSRSRNEITGAPIFDVMTAENAQRKFHQEQHEALKEVNPNLPSPTANPALVAAAAKASLEDGDIDLDIPQASFDDDQEVSEEEQVDQFLTALDREADEADSGQVDMANLVVEEPVKKTRRKRTTKKKKTTKKTS